MTGNRLSFLIPAETESAIRAAAEEAGKTVDEWLTELSQQKIDGLNRAKREKARAEADQAERYRAARGLIDAYEVTHGPIPEEIWRAITKIAEHKADQALAEVDEEARHAEALRAAAELVAETEAKYGPIPEEYWREADELVGSLRAGSPTMLIEGSAS